MKNNINIPDKLNKKYTKAYLNICTKLYLDKKNRAVIVSESIINRPDKNSDLDIIIITTNNYWQRKQLYIDNVFVELFFYSIDEITKSFKDGDYQDMHMIGYGYTVFDKDNNVENLKKMAVKNFKAGPKKLNKEDELLRKYLIWDENQDVLDILKKDEVGAIYLMNRSIWNGLELFFSLKNKWFCKPKLILSSIKELDNNLYNLLNEFHALGNENLSKKYKVYKKIVSIIILPYDTDKPFIWTSKKYKNK